MKRKVTITLEVDPIDYNDAIDSDSGAIDLVNAMLNHDADMPLETVSISCNNECRPWDAESK